MKFSLSWLKRHLDTSAPVADLAAALTALGLEVEEVVDTAAKLAPFRVARILEAVQHPSADRLRVCTVDDGSGKTLNVVCGAPNARAGLTVVLAPVGTTIPANGLIIKKSKIRDVESEGMLCSYAELGLDGDSDGIVELPEGLPAGSPAAVALGADDPLFDIAVTPNRGDCLGVRGIARDLAAAGVGTLKPLEIPAIGGDFDSPVRVRLEGGACPLFVGCTVRGVTNGQSPAWLQKYLKSIGLRPISTLVDITNFVTVDLGRPLHVYDVAKLRGDIRVRLAKDGESLSALNGKEYALTATMTAIADDSGAIGLGGIVGGTSTGCDETTTEVFVEAALFDPLSIARTGRALGIDSDARHRFERGVDPAFVQDGAALAVRVVTELCGGTPSRMVVAGEAPDTRRVIRFSPSRVATLGGVTVEPVECTRVLEALGFAVNGAEVAPPSWRPDISGEADLVEEILRVRGYDAIPPRSLPRAARIADTESQATRFAARARRVLAARGRMEAYTWAFLSEADAGRFGGQAASLALLNPISADLAVMRPSLLPNLLAAAARNQARGLADVRLFEVGAQFAETGERPVAAAVLVGRSARANVHHDDRDVDVFDAKADALAVLEECGVSADKLQIRAEAPAWYHPGRSGVLAQGKAVLAHFGEVHPALAQAHELTGRAIAVEVFLDAIPAPKAKARRVFAASDFQAVTRDFAFLTDATTTADALIRAAAKADPALIREARVFDVYTGAGVPEGKQSVALSVTLQAADRTLTEAEIQSVSHKVVEAAMTACNAVLRS